MEQDKRIAMVALHITGPWTQESGLREATWQFTGRHSQQG